MAKLTHRVVEEGGIVPDPGSLESGSWRGGCVCRERTNGRRQRNERGGREKHRAVLSNIARCDDGNVCTLTNMVATRHVWLVST